MGQGMGPVSLGPILSSSDPLECAQECFYIVINSQIGEQALGVLGGVG